MFPEDLAGSCKKLFNTETWALSTEMGEDPEWGRRQRSDSGRESRQERPGRQRAGWMNVEVGGVPPLRSSGEQRELSFWGRGALRNDRTQQEGGQVAELLTKGRPLSCHLPLSISPFPFSWCFSFSPCLRFLSPRYFVFLVMVIIRDRSFFKS